MSEKHVSPLSIIGGTVGVRRQQEPMAPSPILVPAGVGLLRRVGRLVPDLPLVDSNQRHRLLDPEGIPEF